MKVRAASKVAGRGVATSLEHNVGEALGGSVQAMMRAAGFDNEKDFFKAVEAGQVMSDVLPKFALELKKMAREGGALDKVMEKTRAQLNRFLGDLTRARDTIFQSGADEGLSYMFSNLSAMLKELEPVTKAFGEAFKGMVSTLTAAVRVLLLPLRILSETLTAFGVEDKGGIIWNLVGAGGALYLLAKGFTVVKTAVFMLNLQLVGLLARLMLVLGPLLAVEDVVTAFNGGKAATSGIVNDLKLISEGKAPEGEYMKGAADLLRKKTLSQSISTGNMGTLGLAQMAVMELFSSKPAIEVTVKDSEFGKAVEAKVVESNQRNMAQVASETGG